MSYMYGMWIVYGYYMDDMRNIQYIC